MGRPAVNGPRHYVEAERLLTVARALDDDAGVLAAAQVHATLALAAATALAIDPTPEAVAVWDPLVLEGKDGEPLVEARIECGAHLHPDDAGVPGAIACVLDEGHEDYHSDGNGNRWTT